MSTEAVAAAWFLPILLPVCLYVAFTDLKAMKITNQAVGLMVVVFALGGAILFPLPDYLWRWLHLVVVLVVGAVLNFAGAMGAGDAKFLAAAAPFVALQDVALVFFLLAGTSLAGFLVHRAVRASPLQQLAPDWESWTAGRRFPMGFPLGTAFAAYMVLTVAAG